MSISLFPQACPIAKDVVDEHAARVTAGLVVCTLGASLFFRLPALTLFLTVDFGLRGFGKSAFSPMGRVARAGLRGLGVGSKRTNAGPKRFAAKIGTLFASVVTLALLRHQSSIALGVGSLFLSCALLEATLGVCVGCWMYTLLPWRTDRRDVIVAR